ncbi:MAG TPA: SpoIVB peptidase S55 domain-containing protein, partial [Acidobacteriaceae bacterium]
MQKRIGKTRWLRDFARLGVVGVCLGGLVWAQGQAAAAAGPPPSSAGIFPLEQVRRGMMATAWTVFEGTKPEPMQVEILGVLHNGRGPRHDMILGQLKGEKPEYTGVVAGMSGSPVYIDGKLVGALSYRIGQFSKEPIAGITPIAQMLEVKDAGDRDLADGRFERASVSGSTTDKASDLAKIAGAAAGGAPSAGQTDSFTAIETPLTMVGFGAEAIGLWKQQMAGTGLEAVSAGGQAGGSSDGDFGPVAPGSAVSLELMRGDLEMAATCTVTYV